MRKWIPDLRHDGAFWRRAARLGAVHGPEAFVRYSPPLIGLAWAAALPQARARVREMLRGAGSSASTGEVLQVFARFALSLTEAFAMGSGRNERLSATIVGDSAFQTARARGRGVIVATAHTSGWYAAGPALGSVYDDDVVLVMQRERDASAQAVQDEARQRLGLRVIYVGDDPLAAVPLLAHLKRGGVVALQIDRVTGGMRAVPTTLFGREFAMPAGAFQLAAVSGAPVVPVLGRRTGFLRYEVSVGREIELGRRPSDDDLAHAAAAIAAQLEDFIRRHPTHWYHFSD